MKIQKISAKSDFNALCAKLKVHKMGKKIMSEKKELHFFLIKEISLAAINILKQDALSCGAEVLSPENAILGGKELSTAVLIANEKQLKSLEKKEALQDFGLKELSKYLKLEFPNTKISPNPEIMGVLNITDDSFNPKSRVDEKSIANRASQMIESGAIWLDIGAASTHPDSVYIGARAEFERVKSAVDILKSSNIAKKAKLSIDTFDENCAKYALENGITLLNDISANTALAKIASEYGAKYCLMHGGIKGSSEPVNGDIIELIDEFFEKKIKECENVGLKRENIILDIGICFGKSHEQGLMLIKNLEHFLRFGCELLVGASRKSIINAYHPSSVENRLAGTLFLHQKAIENGASIIRVHDSLEHVQLLALHSAYKAL